MSSQCSEHDEAVQVLYLKIKYDIILLYKW